MVMMPKKSVSDEEELDLRIEAQIWRVACRQLDLEVSIQKIAEIVGSRLPFEHLLIRRMEVDSQRFTTVASAAVRPGEALTSIGARSEWTEDEQPELERWMQRGGLSRSEPGSILSRRVVPPGLEGTVWAGALVTEGSTRGVLVLVGARNREIRREHERLAARLLEPLGVAFENSERIHGFSRVREALEAERAALLSRLQRQDISDVIIGESGGLRGVMERVQQVAHTDAPVLILGETGSGKEVIARAIHARSQRAEGPVVRVNCGAIPPQLIDSELFGHERGSFTGAVESRQGWFERADGGTLFLDEIGELPLAAQVRLLRVLQDGTLERVGGHGPRTVDVRIVAATHQNLQGMVADGTFREDLWYRVSLFPIWLPALRERIEDISALAAHFSHRAGLRLAGLPLEPSPQDVALLKTYAWPGNVRELAAVIERAAILGNGKRLEIAAALGTPESWGPSRRPEGPRENASSAPEREILTLDEVARRHIASVLERTGGQIEGPSGAAVLLGVNPHTFRARMRKLGVDWTQFRGKRRR